MFGRLDDILEKGYTPDAEALPVDAVIEGTAIRQCRVVTKGRGWQQYQMQQGDNQSIGHVFSSRYVDPEQQRTFKKRKWNPKWTGDGAELPTFCNNYTPIRFYERMSKNIGKNYRTDQHFFAEVYLRVRRQQKDPFYMRGGIVHLERSTGLYYDLTLVCARPGLRAAGGKSVFGIIYDLVRQLLRSSRGDDVAIEGVDISLPNVEAFCSGPEDKGGRMLALEATTARSASVFLHKGFRFYPLKSHVARLTPDYGEGAKHDGKHIFHARTGAINKEYAAQLHEKQTKAFPFYFRPLLDMDFTNRPVAKVQGNDVVGEQLWKLVQELNGTSEQERRELQKVFNRLKPELDENGQAANVDHEVDFEVVKDAADAAGGSDEDKANRIRLFGKFVALAALFSILAPLEDKIVDYFVASDFVNENDFVQQAKNMLRNLADPKVTLAFAKKARTLYEAEQPPRVLKLNDARLTMVIAVNNM